MRRNPFTGFLLKLPLPSEQEKDFQTFGKEGCMQGPVYPYPISTPTTRKTMFSRKKYKISFHTYFSQRS